MASAAIIGAKLVGEWALVLLVGETIRPYVYLLVPVILCTVVTAAIWLLSAVLIAIRNTGGLLFSTVAGVLVSVFCADDLVKVFSMNGTSYTIIVSEGIQFFIMLVVCIFTIWRNQDE